MQRLQYMRWRGKSTNWWYLDFISPVDQHMHLLPCICFFENMLDRKRSNGSIKHLHLAIIELKKTLADLLERIKSTATKESNSTSRFVCLRERFEGVQTSNIRNQLYNLWAKYFQLTIIFKYSQNNTTFLLIQSIKKKSI